MKLRFKTLLLCVFVTFCAFQCFNYTTSYYVQNMTEETLTVRTISHSTKELQYMLAPDERIEIYRKYGDPIGVIALSHMDVYLLNENNKIVRYWTNTKISVDKLTAIEKCIASYFKASGVRQLFDNKEWILWEDSDMREYTFNILPEDLIPLEEFIEEEGDTEE